MDTLHGHASWTRFMDMHSGGDLKVPPYSIILIEAPEAEARAVFWHRFHRNPSRVTCTCCGDDYSISEDKSLAQITAYDRGCAREKGAWVERPSSEYWTRGNVTPLDDYLRDKNVLVIRAREIRDEERTADIPDEGYIWH